MYLIAGRSRKASRDSQAARDQGDSFDGRIEDYGFGVSDDAAEGDDDGNDDGDDDGDDSGAEDPELLTQLEALRAEMGPPASSRKGEQPRRRRSQLLLLADQPDTGFEDEDRAIDNVEVTEEDMADPLLLAELSSLAVGGAPPAAKPAATEPASLAATSAAGSDGESMLEALAAHQQQLKATALAAKRQGDMDQARELLVQMKDVQASMKLLQSSQQVAVATGQPESGTDLAAHSPTTSTPMTSTLTTSTPRTLPPARATPVRAAQAAPRSARSTPRQPTANTAPAAAATQASHGGASASEGKDNNAMSFAEMKAELHSQAEKASRLATYFLKAGDKPAALEFHKLKKRAAADLATASSYEANGRPQPPPFLRKEVRWTAPVEQRRDISASELQIAIARMVSDGDLAATLGGRSDFYVQWELAWPRDRGHKAYTRTVRYAEFEASCGDLDVGYSRNVDFVDRQHTRPLARWLDRGRLTVELHKYMGLLWGSQLVGWAALPLSALRTKSEAAALLEIKPAASDAPARAAKPLLGGPVYIDVAARLRLPLSNKPEIESHAERWIYVESDDQNQVQLQGREPATAQPAVDKIPDEASAPPATAQSVVEKADGEASAPPAESSTTVASPDEPAQPTGDDIAVMLDAIDGLVSNATLELELSQLPVRMKAARDKDTAEQIRDLEAAIKLRMSVIAAQVGAGVLSIQDYMGGVATELAQAKEWALTANRAGRKDLAVRALKRVKAMQSELSEMRAAMDAESE